MQNKEKCKAVAERIFLNDLSECEYFPKYIEIECVREAWKIRKILAI